MLWNCTLRSLLSPLVGCFSRIFHANGSRQLDWDKVVQEVAPSSTLKLLVARSNKEPVDSLRLRSTTYFF